MRAKALVAAVTAASTIIGGAGSAFAASTSSGTSAAPAGASSSCDDHWPGYVQGRPDHFDAGDDAISMWHNPTGGWGLRVTHPVLPGRANRVVFTGAIRSAGKIVDVKRVADEKDDVVKVGEDGHTLYFRFVNYGAIDGVDFATTCTPGLQVNLKVDGGAVQPRFVHLGDKKVNPKSVPFTIRRVDADHITQPAPNPPAPPAT